MLLCGAFFPGALARWREISFCLWESWKCPSSGYCELLGYMSYTTNSQPIPSSEITRNESESVTILSIWNSFPIDSTIFLLTRLLAFLILLQSFTLPFTTVKVNGMASVNEKDAPDVEKHELESSTDLSYSSRWSKQLLTWGIEGRGKHHTIHVGGDYRI